MRKYYSQTINCVDVSVIKFYKYALSLEFFRKNFNMEKSDYLKKIFLEYDLSKFGNDNKFFEENICKYININNHGRLNISLGYDDSTDELYRIKERIKDIGQKINGVRMYTNPFAARCMLVIIIDNFKDYYEQYKEAIDFRKAI